MKARALYEKASALESAARCYDIAADAKLGRGGTPPDLATARKHDAEACNLRFGDAGSALKALPPG